MTFDPSGLKGGNFLLLHLNPLVPRWQIVIAANCHKSLHSARDYFDKV